MLRCLALNCTSKRRDMTEISFENFKKRTLAYIAGHVVFKVSIYLYMCQAIVFRYLNLSLMSVLWQSVYQSTLGNSIVT